MIQPEAALLSILLNSEMYNKYRPYINVKDDRELQHLYTILDTMMEKYGRDLSFTEYSLYVVSNSKDVEVTTHLLNVIKEANVQPDVAEELLLQYKERNLAHHIALLAIDITEGRKSFLELKEKINEHDTIKEELQEDLFVEDDLESL